VILGKLLLILTHLDGLCKELRDDVFALLETFVSFDLTTEHHSHRHLSVKFVDFLGTEYVSFSFLLLQMSHEMFSLLLLTPVSAHCCNRGSVQNSHVDAEGHFEQNCCYLDEELVTHEDLLAKLAYEKVQVVRIRYRSLQELHIIES